MTEKQKEAMEVAAKFHEKESVDRGMSPETAMFYGVLHGYKTALSPEHIRLLTAEQLLQSPLVLNLVSTLSCWSGDDDPVLTPFKKKGE